MIDVREFDSLAFLRSGLFVCKVKTQISRLAYRLFAHTKLFQLHEISTTTNRIEKSKFETDQYIIKLI